MTPPVKPSRRRAPNLVTTFTADEVRVMDAVMQRVLKDGSKDARELQEFQQLASVADKFARLREKARSGS